MTFQEAFDKCESSNWTKYVLMNPELLGPNVFLTMSYYTRVDTKGPVSGVIDRSRGKYLKMVIYEGGNNFRDDIKLPYKVVDPDSEGWEAKVFIGDLSIGGFDCGGISLSEENGNIEVKDLQKLQEFIKKAIKDEFRLSLLNLDDITDINNYFN